MRSWQHFVKPGGIETARRIAAARDERHRRVPILFTVAAKELVIEVAQLPAAGILHAAGAAEYHVDRLRLAFALHLMRSISIVANFSLVASAVREPITSGRR